MPLRDRAAFAALIGSNMYVPGMQAAAHLQIGEPAPYSLGSPAAASANLIAAATAANAAAGTTVSYAVTMDSTYGRTVRLTPSGDPGNAAAVDLYGFDYLGQPMIERFTGASGSTAILYGQKALYRVTKSVIVTPSANAVTWAIGTGFRFGIPYKGDVVWAKEAGVFVNVAKRQVFLEADRSAAESVAGASRFFRAPFPGYVDSVYATSAGNGGATDAVVTVKLATVAIVGLTVTIDANGAAGAFVTDQPTTLGYNANNRFRAGDLIEVAAAAAAGAGNDRIGLILIPTQVSLPDQTDPATRITGDTRGTYEPIVTPGVASELIVGVVADAAVNAAGNGGLHGIRQFNA